MLKLCSGTFAIFLAWVQSSLCAKIDISWPAKTADKGKVDRAFQSIEPIGTSDSLVLAASDIATRE